MKHSDKIQKIAANKQNSQGAFYAIFLRFVVLLSLAFLVSCSQLEKPKPEPFYAETAPPQKKEFRWSNGKMPKSFDPAAAAAAPETAIVGAIYEGLTETDPKTLQPIPAIAVEWKPSEDFKTWTFSLRKDAHWSNGERVTAKDFVRSWKRLVTLGEKVAHRELLQNFVGSKIAATENLLLPDSADSVLFSKPTSGIIPNELSNVAQTNSNTVSNSSSLPNVAGKKIDAKAIEEKPVETPFGVEATDNFTLKISLVKPDKDLPALVAHPIFRPIYGDGKNFETNKLSADVVTNGAFRISSVGQDGITLDRAEKYWGREAVELERVRFVPIENAEKALAAYRAGEIDAVTNADFEPLALKLLTPFEDFRRVTYGALNFYEFNLNKPPFNDRRVREALAISIERKRLTEDEMDGASLPALSFLPFEKADSKKLVEDTEKAKNLLAESGFPEGENFPPVKLLVNRNNVQQRIAKSVAKMWKQNLNVETEIVVEDTPRIAEAWAKNEFDLLRRGITLPTVNETINMLAIFPPHVNSSSNAAESNQPAPNNNSPTSGNSNPDSPVLTDEKALTDAESTRVTTLGEQTASGNQEESAVMSETQALTDLPGIPLYFPTSYSLVKPYIQGFEINILDAPSLKNVRIDNNWQPKAVKKES